MIKELDNDLTKRVNKAIINIRLISTRVKRASLEDALQRSSVVVAGLDNFRKYISANIYNPAIAGVDTAFKHDGATMAQMVEALQQADIIYKMLTKQKQVSYKEEIKQIKLLIFDIIEYLENILQEIDNNAKKQERPI